MTESVLPSKILPALRRLHTHYARKNEEELVTIIDACKVFIKLETAFDGWNGGMDGHDVLLFVPHEVMGLIDLDNQQEIFDRIREDLGKALSNLETEFINAVFINPYDETDREYQAAIPFSLEPRVDPKSTGLWAENSLRLFISHRDEHKALAHKLAEGLEPYGVDAFVAHDAIKPMKKWQQEILNGLMTMEVMLILLTDDFHESTWTNQEVGFALGKGIPILSVKIADLNPQGFLSTEQALKVKKGSDISISIPKIHNAIMQEIGQKGRLKVIMIEAFLNSTNYSDTIASLTRLTETVDKITDKEFYRIVKGYSDNGQLYSCGGIHNKGNWFKRYLENATGKKLDFKNGTIKEIIEDDIPF